jgi:hypothetical protein
MKKLYRATFYSVIYAAAEDEALEIADSLEANCLLFHKDSLLEITTTSQIPISWLSSNHPVIDCRENYFKGVLYDKNIEEILEDRDKIPVPVTSAESILELKNEVRELKKVITALIKEKN